MTFKKLITLTAIFLALGSLRAEVETGSAAPAFTLAGMDGKEYSLSDFEGKYVVLEWLNHECPFVVKHYKAGNMQALQKEYTEKGVIWLSINSSAEGKQGHLTAETAKAITEEKEAAPTNVLFDHDGTVGKEYGAKTTPHMYVIDPEGTLIYQGAIDSIKSTDSDDIAEATNYVKQALDSAMAGEAVPEATTQPYGCSVKY